MHECMILLVTHDKSSMGLTHTTERKTTAATKTTEVQHASLVKSLSLDIDDNTLHDALEGCQGPGDDMAELDPIDVA